MTDSNTSDALDVIAELSAQGDVENGMSLPAGDAIVLDEAAGKIGLRTGELVGLPNQYRPGGVGDAAEALDYGTRLASVHPKAIGAAMIGPIPNQGSIDARSSVAIIGGYARTEHHAHGAFMSSRDTTREYTFPAGDYRRIDGVELNVKVESGKNALLLATAFIDGRPISSSAYIDIVICIGSEATRIVQNGPSIDFYENVDGSDSLSVPIGGDPTGARQQATVMHGRLITGNETTEAAGVPCFVKVKQIGSGGGGGGGTTAKFKAGDTARTTANAYIRSSAAIADNIIDTISQGSQGTINSGPSRNDGYTWWNITIGGYTGWMAENYLVNVTATTTPPPTTNSIRTASLRIERIPL